MTQSLEFTAHISVMLLGILLLAFSYSSHRTVPFGCTLSYTPRWFDRYSSLTLIFESFLKTFQRESRSITQLQRLSKSYPPFRILKPLLFLYWFEQVCILLVYLQRSFLLFSRDHFVILIIHTFFSLQCLYSLHS